MDQAVPCEDPFESQALVLAVDGQRENLPPPFLASAHK